MTVSPINPHELVLLDQLIQDFQGVLLSIHAACEPIDAREPVRATIDASLDGADRVLEKWRDRVKSKGGPDNPAGSGQTG